MNKRRRGHGNKEIPETSPGSLEGGTPRGVGWKNRGWGKATVGSRQTKSMSTAIHDEVQQTWAGMRGGAGAAPRARGHEEGEIPLLSISVFLVRMGTWGCGRPRRCRDDAGGMEGYVIFG
jgi:hypothetical protein